MYTQLHRECLPNPITRYLVGPDEVKKIKSAEAIAGSDHIECGPFEVAKDCSLERQRFPESNLSSYPHSCSVSYNKINELPSIQGSGPIPYIYTFPSRSASLVDDVQGSSQAISKRQAFHSAEHVQIGCIQTLNFD